jgi:hypothetical protein
MNTENQVNELGVKSRRFLGNLFPEKLPTRERNFEKAHLKAYLAGHKRFTFGFDITGNSIYYTVAQEVK